jgi:hypothetical protein
MQTSLLRTLASKHRSTVTKMAVKHRAKITTPLGPRTCYEAIVQRTERHTIGQRLVTVVGSFAGDRQAGAYCEDDELSPVAGAEFEHGPADVGPYCCWAEEKLGGYLVVGPAGGRPRHDLTFPLCQGRHRRRRGDPAGQMPPE